MMHSSHLQIRMQPKKPDPLHRSVCTNQKCNATSHLGPPSAATAPSSRRYMGRENDRVAIHLGAGLVRPVATVSLTPIIRATCPRKLREKAFHVGKGGGTGVR